MKKVLSVSLLLILANFVFGQDTISLKDFLAKEIYIESIKSEFNILTINGSKNGSIVKEYVSLKKNEVLGVWQTSFKPTLSIITIPFKVRPKQDTLSQNILTGLSNAGFNISFYNKKLDRYFVSGEKITHNFGAGLLISPTAIELSPENTNKIVITKSNQLFISTSLSLTYSFNDITLSLIPIGFDFATTKDGKNYIYNKKMWWGFGIGIETKLFGL
jgi:hypothetical protein